jgi:hypothetical protein
MTNASHLPAIHSNAEQTTQQYNNATANNTPPMRHAHARATVHCCILGSWSLSALSAKPKQSQSQRGKAQSRLPSSTWNIHRAVPCSPSQSLSLSSTRVRLRPALRLAWCLVLSCLLSCLVPSIYSYTTATDENMKTPTTKMWKMWNGKCGIRNCVITITIGFVLRALHSFHSIPQLETGIWNGTACLHNANGL